MNQTDKKNYYDTTAEICGKLDFPQDAAREFLSLERTIAQTPVLADALEEQVRLFCDAKVSIHDIIPEIKKAAREFGINFYTLNLLWVMHCAPYTREEYKANGLSDALYWDGLADLKYKLSECRAVKGVNGTFTEDWYEGFLRLGRFTLGRFQFEPFGLYEGEDKKLECGYVLKNDTRFVLIHIPGSGEPFSDEARESSYELAYDYFKDWVGSDTVLLHTYSWLLYPRSPEFLPESSNTVRFMRDFDIYEWRETDEFYDAWRVFGSAADRKLPTEEWPENTSMQRAYKKWLLDGNKAGVGKGFIVMHNGKNVTHIKDYFR